MNIDTIRRDFPILKRSVNDQSLTYLDNAATTQKPATVIEAVSDFYRTSNANVDRGVHQLSQEATEAVVEARTAVADFLSAEAKETIVFVRGTTEAINAVADTFGRAEVGPGDTVVVSEMAHHANFVPWQRLCNSVGATLEVVSITDMGTLDMKSFSRAMTQTPKLCAITHVSNTLGTINPIRRCIEIAHDHDVPVLVDGAQAVGHMPVDVQDLDCDFYVFSGHKVFGPTGIGCLYAKRKYLADMDPYQVGGGMVMSVTKEKTTFRAPPARLEAGTPHIAGIVGLRAAIAYVRSVGWDAILEHEADLLAYMTDQLHHIDGLHVIGTAGAKVPIVSFVIDGVHPHDVGTILDKAGVAVRTGHHCTQPTMDRFGVPATTRISAAFYNTNAEIDRCVEAIEQTKRIFQV